MSKYRIRHHSENGTIYYTPEKRYMWIFWVACENKEWFFNYEDAVLYVNRLKAYDEFKDTFTFL